MEAGVQGCIVALPCWGEGLEEAETDLLVLLDCWGTQNGRRVGDEGTKWEATFPV